MSDASLNAAVIYARQSTRLESQDGSVDKQVDALREAAHVLGLPVIGVFRDEGKSGAGLIKRTALTDAVAKLRRGDVLMIRDPTRIARRLVLSLLVEEAIFERGAHLWIASEGAGALVDWQSESQRIARVFHYLQAEAQLYSLRHSCLVGAARRKAAGKRTNGDAPYGFRLEGDNVVPDESEQSVLELMRSQREMGWSLQAVADYHTDRGVLNRGRPWHRSTVHRLTRADEPVKTIKRKSVRLTRVLPAFMRALKGGE